MSHDGIDVARKLTFKSNGSPMVLEKNGQKLMDGYNKRYLGESEGASKHLDS